jgi:succinate dehydrogenase / fumarate reductase, flavoprotein subunit
LIENRNINSINSCDILIIGGGSAGLRAAIEAHDAGINIIIVSKTKKGNPHSSCSSEAARLTKEVTEEYIHRNDSLLPPSKLNENNPKEFEDEIPMVSEPITFRNEIQEIMQRYAGIIRDEKKLQKGLKRILELKEEFYSKDNIPKEFQINSDNIENVILTSEVKSSLVVCEAIIKCAIMRQESRGAHYRSDFPNIDDEKWKVNIYCKKKDEGIGMALFTEPVKEIKGPLKDLLKSHYKLEHHREFE